MVHVCTIQCAEKVCFFNKKYCLEASPLPTNSDLDVLLVLFLILMCNPSLSSQMTSWVCTEILSRESPSARATVIEHLINMARTCYRHNDMHCALSITLALKSTPIKRLTKTWDSVDRRVSGRLAAWCMGLCYTSLHDCPFLMSMLFLSLDSDKYLGYITGIVLVCRPAFVYTYYELISLFCSVV